ncbi:HD domain-containing protein [Novosphingobium sp. KACC 22771]|uniref:HD domain-containing protein n=1 Tax=Novosphingobium sp. KACC 22771 TaxID=3025670 RepID=UPI002366D716|nr:hypothetical protein [Novosphingobium sp. KACC 22771]WDF74563.1 hypothetical protein PQ467_21740 [Novosphingobium sp. KACC 22771]
MSDHPWLIAAFERLNIPGTLCAQIIAHHSEPHRHYHTLRHIELMLRQIPSDHAFTAEMLAATLFHDIIYDPTRSDNEEQSLALFQSVSDRLAPPQPIDTGLISAMIAATRSHHFRDQRSSEDEAVNLLLKADLSILWHDDRAVYAWYADGVRKEYAFVPEDRFREARVKILTGLCHDLLHSQQLTTAQAMMLESNIGWELGLLHP